jgi:UDP-N-acetyl-2-amino-2-deoxyglucuronate dehydrogenase
MNQIGTAIIGAGKVAATHAEAFRSLPESRFVAVCDVHAERAAGFAAKYGVRAYTGVDEMLRDPAVQMVSICTPHPQHAAAAVAAGRAGVSVLVEKPMAVSLEQCDRMIEAAASTGAKLGVVSQRRLYEPVQRVKRAIETGKIGGAALGMVTVLGWRGPEYYAMDAWRGTWDGEGGGVLVNQTSHQLDLFQWLMGPVEELFGYWANLNHPYIEVEDTAIAVIRFRSGALGNIAVSNSQNPGLDGKIHVFGRSGAGVGVQTDGGSMFVAGVSAAVDPPINDLWTVSGEESLLPQWQAEDRARAGQIDVMSHYHRLQIQDFLRAIQEDRAPMVPGEEGRKTVELFTAIYRCQRERQPVRWPL